MTTICSHLDRIRITEHSDAVEGCEECLRTGGRRVQLRMCETCGQVGCCNSSPCRHASEHAREARHPILRSIEPGEDWR